MECDHIRASAPSSTLEYCIGLQQSAWIWGMSSSRAVWCEGVPPSHHWACFGRLPSSTQWSLAVHWRSTRRTEVQPPCPLQFIYRVTGVEATRAGAGQADCSGVRYRHHADWRPVRILTPGGCRGFVIVDYMVLSGAIACTHDQNA